MYDHWNNMLAGKPLSHIKLYSKLTSIFRAGYSAPIYEKWLECEDEKACFLMERFLIKTFERKSLCNLTDGGEGSSGCIPSQQTRQKLSAANKGRTFSAKFCQQITERQTGEKNHRFGKPMHDNTRQAMRKANTGRINSPEYCQQITERQLGKRNHQFGKTPTLETRRKLSDALVGRPKSEEHNLKVREAWKAFNARRTPEERSAAVRHSWINRKALKLASAKLAAIQNSLELHLTK